MNKVVAANRESIAVPGNDPHLQIGPRDFQAECHGWGAAMNSVESISIHVVGETARATYSRDKHDVFPGEPVLGADLRHHSLYLRENRVIAAARTPAYGLVRGEIFPAIFSICRVCHYRFPLGVAEDLRDQSFRLAPAWSNRGS